MTDTLTLGKRMVPIERIVLIESFDPAQSKIQSDRMDRDPAATTPSTAVDTGPSASIIVANTSTDSGFNAVSPSPCRC